MPSSGFSICVIIIIIIIITITIIIILIHLLLMIIVMRRQMPMIDLVKVVRVLILRTLYEGFRQLSWGRRMQNVFAQDSRNGPSFKWVGVFSAFFVERNCYHSKG